MPLTGFQPMVKVAQPVGFEKMKTGLYAVALAVSPRLRDGTL
jgi:hypothetical protein